MIKTEMGSVLGDGAGRPSDEVSRLTRQRIQRYLDSRDDPSLYQSTRNMSQIVADDYGNRFLVELIQNAHDAHDASRTDGEISIVLEANDDFGCLYVANRGSGFVGENLKAITSVALSSKPVNAGAGNKGLGFRSVLQICHWPEIYSVQGAGSGTFDGYCFRFAQLDDLRAALQNESPEFVEEMAHNLPFWHLPIPVEPSARVKAFAQQGFATVIRLPLKSADALQAVRTQFQALRDLRVPLHLFLDRIRSITLDDGGAERVVLDRAVQDTWTLQPPGTQVESPITVTRLRLGTEDLVVACWDVDEASFRAALQSSLDKSEVPESWGAWQGAARISVAVPLGTPLETGRLYCFLPLGPDGRAPVGAYINANFYTKMDRRTVDPSIRLNDFFMRQSVWVSCQLIHFLVTSGWPQAPAAVVSLLCWSDSYLDTLKQSMLDSGKSILEGSFLPVRGPADTVGWTSPQHTYSWTASSEACLAPKAIADVAGGQVLVDSLAPHQRLSLDLLYQRLRLSDFVPPPAVIADWVEKIAEQLHAHGAPPERWAAFYDEVAAALTRHPDTLFGKKFLLSVGGELIVSELPLPSGSSGRARRAADVYFAPVLAVDAEVDDDDSKKALPLEQMPADLAKGFALLSRDVPWLKDDGGHRPGRSFLLAGKLAREYDTRDVLRTLAGVTRSAQNLAVRVQALEWAFRLWSSARSLAANETRLAAFHVPTAAGWVGADAAMFGVDWDTLNAKKLQALLRTGSAISEDLRRSLSHLLTDYAQWPVAYGEQADWIRFLNAAGVADCLRPIIDDTPAVATSSRASMPAAVAQRVPKFSEIMRAHWRGMLAEDCARMFISCVYRADLKAWRLPGQFDHELFPADLRRDYAVQVALSMRALTDEHLVFRAVRSDGGTDRHGLSTPLLAFLTGAPWLPVSRPQSLVRFVKPSEAWHFRHDEERPPRFADFLMMPVVDALDSASIERLRARGHLGLFNDKRHAGRALAYLCESATPGLSEIRDTRRFYDLFARLWHVARAENTLVIGSEVPVTSGGVIATLSSKDEGDENGLGSAYFDDEPDGLKKQLLKEVGKQVFDFVRGDSEAAWDWVNATAPGRFSRISDEPADVYVDGIQFDDQTPKQLLTEAIGPWIVDFLVCVAEHKGGAFFLATQNTLNAVRRAASTLSVVVGREIRIAHGEHRMPLPASVQGALALLRPEGAVLVVEATGALTLDMLSKGAAQLAAALGPRQLANGLDAALLRLAALLRAGDLQAPDDDIVATALGVEPAAIGHTRRLVSGDLIGMLKFAIPLAACRASPETTASLRELNSQDEPADAELRAALGALATRLHLSLVQLEDQLLAVLDLPDLKERFRLPIQQLNTAIFDLGAPYQPVSNELKHRAAWTRHVNQQQPAILERLRARAVVVFDRQQPLNQYIQTRDEVLAAPPDLAWFTTYDELPESVMEAQIAGWIDACMEEVTSELPLTSTLAETRMLNGERLRRFWDAFSPLISAWSTAPGMTTTLEVREFWMRTDGAREALFARARKGGWLDFRALDDAAIAVWLGLDGNWPSGRPVNRDPSVWGLTTTHVTSNEERVKAERAAQLLRRTQVDFAGTKMSALSNGYAAIAAAVAGQSDAAPGLANAAASEAALQTVDPSRSGGGYCSGGGGGGFNRSSEASMSDEQKMAIGLIGELWAREWLRRRHKLAIADENVWFSGYRDSVLNTVGGSDTLGYDFKVETPSVTYYYEVKASLGDPRRFEMGPTEIFAAQRYRADGDNRYRILYIAHAGDPTRMTATLLHNPYSNKGAARFQTVGRGSVTYEFNLS